MPESHHRSGSRTTTALLIATAISLIATLVGTSVPAQAAAVRAARASYPKAIEPLAGYQAQTTCSPTAKPGVADFAARLLRAYPSTRSLGIVRACSVGGRSEHKEGRAFDWGGLNAARAADRDRVKRFTTWLFKADRYGNRYAMARRLGIQYVIWNRKIWGSYSASSGWRRYTGANSHRDHVHISFTWAGARKKTSFWTGKVGNVQGVPTPSLPIPTPTPTPTTPTGAPPRPMPAPAAWLPGGPDLTDETLVVPAATAEATTTGSLTAGQEYLVEVSGTYRYGPRPMNLADAECSRTPNDATWRRDRSVHSWQPGEDHLDLYVDGNDLYADADVDDYDGCDTRTHTYRDTYTPSRTGRVTFALWDPTTLSDNAGALTVRIIAKVPQARMDWQVPATAAAGVTSPGAVEGGGTYLVTVTGSVDAGAGVTSDAECSWSSTDPVWRRDRSVDPADPTADHLDLLLDRNDMTFKPVWDPDGDGCDTTTHSYRLVLTPSTTRTVNLRVDDPAWTDDSGALTVRVERVDPVVGDETVALDTASVTDLVTTRNYLAGQRLKLTATGTYVTAPGITADAECSATTADPTWRASRADLYAEGRYLGDVTMNGSPGDWVTSTTARCDPTTHAYSWFVTPSVTGPLSLGVADTDRTNNSGILAVTISPAS